MSEQEQRQKVVAIAKTWLKTPYHHMAKIKGVGVDCLTLLSEVYREAGLVGELEIPYYPKDFMQHSGAELYLDGLLKHAYEIDTKPQAGDIIIWKFGRCFSHTAIVIDYPQVIHACAGSSVTIDDAEAAEWLSSRPHKVFSYWK